MASSGSSTSSSMMADAWLSLCRPASGASAPHSLALIIAHNITRMIHRMRNGFRLSRAFSTNQRH
jgi:hypothetical protein